MIGKITGGASFGGALDYLTKPKEPKLEHEKEQYKERLKEAQHTPGEPAPPFEVGERHRVIGGNMNGDTRGELAEEFRTISRQRPDIRKPVHHASLSAGENDRISVEQWNEIAEKYVEKMGFGDAPYVVIQHRDGKTDHIHILTSRVDIRGKVISDWQCKERAEKVLRGIEKEYGLEQIKPSREVERAAPKRGELEWFNRTGELSAKMSLQGHVQDALKDTPTATQFIEKLQLVNVDVIPYVGEDGRATGISFRKGKQLMKGSDLGRGFSWNALQRRGLDYNPERDRPAIEAARLRADASPTKAVEAPTISTPAPERTFTDIAQDVGRAAGQYVLDQVNPIQQFQSQVQVIQQAGQTLVEGYNLAKELLIKDNSIENLQRATEVQADNRDAFERLREATGTEPSTTSHSALERLSETVGMDRTDPIADLNQTLDKTPVQEIVPALEPAIEEHAIEQTLAPIMSL
jgi:Relaxase/Mobilisation nuclease domain